MIFNKLESLLSAALCLHNMTMKILNCTLIFHREMPKTDVISKLLKYLMDKFSECYMNLIIITRFRFDVTSKI